ncbi:MAG TPA: efflux RND transporter periplasmic adaptor subunit [Rhodanobacteraceae bacterium]|nr:efflux RND transporter periplasmic adaptor subunit [Rhodanobacteraceae bacterium]
MPRLRVALCLPLALALAACGKSKVPPPPPPQVGVVVAHAQSMPLVSDFVGRLEATRTAQVRARVTGIVLKRIYTEGTDVKVGDVLFRIDPAPLQAALRAQQGQLDQAAATAHDDEMKATRMRELAARGVIAKQDLDDAVAAAEGARASVQAARGNVETAKINLGYATITAPISGRAGRANVTEGALVSPTDTTPLTTIEQIDPIYVDFSQPMAEVETLRRAQASGDLKLAAPDQAQVQLLLPDGSVYAHTGTLNFADLAVDPQTGAVSLRATVPNPERTLLPGMFVKLRLTLGQRHHAYQVPQSAVQRDAQGAYLLIVGAGDKVRGQRVTLDSQRGSQWVVESGLHDGDRVIVSGVQKAQPGATVQPVPYQRDQAPAPAATSAGSAGY